MSGVLINPPLSHFGTSNAVLSGRDRRYAGRFIGPLSVKTVVTGTATWETAEGRYELAPGTSLLLHAQEEYAIRVEGLQPVETFCFFFADGFVEDAWHAATTASAKLLDREAPAARVTFAERLRFDGALTEEMRRAHWKMREGLPLEDSFYAAAMHLVRARCELESRIEALPALRLATREELARRIARGTSFLHANLHRPISMGEAAREACLSPFHFHRVFASFHRQTPHRYLTRLRLEHARALLRAGDRPIAEVAAACGFRSVGSFTTLFTRRVGVAPARFRRIEETR